MIASSLIKAYLAERQIRSIPPEELIGYLRNSYTKEHGENPKSIEIVNDGDVDMHVKMVYKYWIPPKGVDQGNYEHSEFSYNLLKKTGWEVYNVQAHYPAAAEINLVPITKSADKPEFLYHSAPTSLEDKILKQGLKPTARGFSNMFYPARRIYLHKELNKFFIKMLMRDIVRKSDIEGSASNFEFTVFEIDTLKFNRFNLYVDKFLPDNAVYTLTHIPAKALSVAYRDKT